MTDKEQEISDKLIKIASGAFRVPPNTLNLNITYQDLETWDSLAHLNLFLSLEEEFQINFSTGEITQLFSLKDILNNILEKLNNS